VSARFATVGVGGWFGYRDRIPARKDGQTDRREGLTEDYIVLLQNSQKRTVFFSHADV
jgi:hypothetical protein